MLEPAPDSQQSEADGGGAAHPATMIPTAD
jgi:hypothetical protein